ncbi:MAG TPA: histidine phosphatase family protein [Acidobacteriota bacterium]|jgi:phosphohistidine phosphatase
MILCFVRHAIAADRQSWKEDDEKRPLTAEGVKKMKRVADALSLMGGDFTYICTSPLRRARQTAKILSRKSEHSAETLIWSELVPGSPPQDLLNKLQVLSRKRQAKPAKSGSASRRVAPGKSQKASNDRRPAVSGNSAQIALVGHEPHLSQTVSYLLCGDAHKMSIAFKKSGVCCLEYNGKIPATLRWFLPPRMAASIAKRS